MSLGDLNPHPPGTIRVLFWVLLLVLLVGAATTGLMLGGAWP